MISATKSVLRLHAFFALEFRDFNYLHSAVIVEVHDVIVEVHDVIVEVQY